ncbi:MAG TPA: hypothetical protein ENI22_01520 [Candidatus Pacearchaeota archaeon]|nr:hypothetical protein [Candidatus Pacearchaeota archaeon]
MSIKNALRNSWKFLPFVSLLRSDPLKDATLKGVGKALGHAVYAVAAPMVPIVYLTGSLAFGTANPSRWNEIGKERRREAQEYNQLYDRATNCVEEDGNLGLTSLGEITKLYSKAGVTVNYKPEIRRPKLPILKKAHLERVVQNCETEEGKLR